MEKMVETEDLPCSQAFLDLLIGEKVLVTYVCSNAWVQPSQNRKASETWYDLSNNIKSEINLWTHLPKYRWYTWLNLLKA